jgi:N-acetylmuramic acid 6-phosphate (MurNAc-6-P) etherase
MIQTITGVDRDEARALLESAEGRVKTALVMHARRVDRPTAEAMLKEADEHVGRIIDSADVIG